MKTFASVIVVAGLFLTAASVAIRADHPHAGQNLKDAKWSPTPRFWSSATRQTLAREHMASVLP